MCTLLCLASLAQIIVTEVSFMLLITSNLFYSYGWVTVYFRKLLNCRLLCSTDALDVRISEVKVQKHVCLTCIRGTTMQKLSLETFKLVQIGPTMQLFVTQNKLITVSIQVWDLSFLWDYFVDFHGSWSSWCLKQIPESQLCKWSFCSKAPVNWVMSPSVHR